MDGITWASVTFYQVFPSKYLKQTISKDMLIDLFFAVYCLGLPLFLFPFAGVHFRATFVSNKVTLLKIFKVNQLKKMGRWDEATTLLTQLAASITSQDKNLHNLGQVIQSERLCVDIIKVGTLWKDIIEALYFLLFLIQ